MLGSMKFHKAKAEGKKTTLQISVYYVIVFAACLYYCISMTVMSVSAVYLTIVAETRGG